MFKSMFIVMIVAHVIIDFYIYPKTRPSYNRFIHTIFYFATQLILIKLAFSIDLGLETIAFAFIIYAVAVCIINHFKNKKSTNSYFDLYEQLIYIIMLFSFSLFVVYSNISISISKYITELLQLINLENYNIINFCIIALILHTPVNDLCKIILSKYKSDGVNTTDNNDSETENKSLKTGAFIGTLERLIIVAMIFEGEYSAIGLIFAAKSVARYDKISHDKEFAEYYLLGSLFSVLSTLVVYNIIM